MAEPTTKRKAMFNSTCKSCGGPYTAGDWIVRLSVGRFAHVLCPEAVIETAAEMIRYGATWSDLRQFTSEELEAAYRLVPVDGRGKPIDSEVTTQPSQTG